MFAKLRTPTLRSLASLPLCCALCACLTLHPQLNSQDSPCIRILLASGLLEQTPGAAKGQIDGTAGGLGDYAVAETGQLVKANIDKATAKKIGASCDAEWTAALKAAQHKKFLGIF
jgi:hypothetical protein